MKKQRALLILFCFVWSAAGCGNRYTEPAYSQEETLVQGEDSLSPHTGALVTLDAERLSSEQVVWGPGREMDAENRPTACVELQEKYGRYGAVFLTEEEGICLTFDEGYENGYTAQILDVLKENNVPAAFFVTGPYLDKEEELVRRMFDEGHIVGNHTVHHPSMPQLESTDKAAEEVVKLTEMCKEKYGQDMKYFRPPRGEYSERTLRLTSDLGYTNVFWSFAYKDWDVKNQKGTEYAYDQIKKGVHDGAVLLLHAVSKDNADVLDRVIKDLKSEGYHFRSLDEFGKQ